MVVVPDSAATINDGADSASTPLPGALYQQLLDEDRISADPAQKEAVRHLDALHQRLLNTPEPPTGIRALLGKLNPKPIAPVKGLYLWGGVGAGKTLLMDLFYDSLPFTQKVRTHFHRFMHQLQIELKEMQGEQNPLSRVADKLAQRARVLCFDEFVINDIGDAMILAGFLDAMFARGVCLVATSNTQPARLYENGLQRARFLPAIELIETHLNIFKLEAARDYRLRLLARAPTYYVAHDADSDAAFRKLMLKLATTAPRYDEMLNIDGREILSIACTDDIAWFDFNAICEAPRGKGDYIEIACNYSTLLISDVPVMQDKNDQARRFITLVDELYDRNVKLILSAEAEPQSLYRNGRLKDEFIRTASRLMEMRTQSYISKQHFPESNLSAFH